MHAKMSQSSCGFVCLVSFGWVYLLGFVSLVFSCDYVIIVGISENIDYPYLRAPLGYNL